MSLSQEITEWYTTRKPLDWDHPIWQEIFRSHLSIAGDYEGVRAYGGRASWSDYKTTGCAANTSCAVPRWTNAKVTRARKTDKMQEAGVAEPTITKWASPVLLVPNKDRIVGFCKNYRWPNFITFQDSQFILRMDVCTDLLGEAQMFFYFGCKLEILGDRGGQQRRRKDCVCRPSRFIQLFSNGVWAQKRIWNVPVSNGVYTGIG